MKDAIRRYAIVLEFTLAGSVANTFIIIATTIVAIYLVK